MLCSSCLKYCWYDAVQYCSEKQGVFGQLQNRIGILNEEIYLLICKKALFGHISQHTNKQTTTASTHRTYRLKDVFQGGGAVQFEFRGRVIRDDVRKHL